LRNSFGYIDLLQTDLTQFVLIELVHSAEYASLPNYEPCYSDNETDNARGCEKSLELLFEALSTPSKEDNPNQMSRFHDNTITYLSPATTCLHNDLACNLTPTKLHHTTETLHQSQKSILEMIQYGMIEENEHAAEIFDDLEKFVQKTKWKFQDIILNAKNKDRRQGQLEFAAYMIKRKKPEKRLKGVAG
jgi:hypothetical protein